MHIHVSLCFIKRTYVDTHVCHECNQGWDENDENNEGINGEVRGGDTSMLSIADNRDEDEHEETSMVDHRRQVHVSNRTLCFV